jgi:exosome complex RNA-binding protein Rrp42 (RNase PH superfamily)
LPPSDLLVAPGELLPITSPEDAADVIDKNGHEVLSWRDRLIRLQAWVSVNRATF